MYAWRSDGSFIYATPSYPFPNMDRYFQENDYAKKAMETYAITIAELHNAGFVHGDPVFANFLYDSDKNNVLLIDLDNLRYFPRHGRKFHEYRRREIEKIRVKAGRHFDVIENMYKKMLMCEVL